MAVYKKTSFTTPLSTREVTNQMPQKSDLPQSLQDSMTTVNNLASTTSGKWFVCKCEEVVGSDSPKAKGQFYPVYFAVNTMGVVVGNVVAAPCPPFCNDDTSAIYNERINRLESVIGKIAIRLDIQSFED